MLVEIVQLKKENAEMLKALQTVAAVMVPRTDDEAQAINDVLEVIVKATGGAA
jgi:hypothetical protein